MKFFKKISIIISYFLLFSCAESLDFSQLKDYVSSSNYEVALSYFSITNNEFYDEIRDIYKPVEDVVSFELFEEKIIQENLTNLSLNVEIINNLESNINISIELLTKRGNHIYTFSKINVKKGELDYLFSENVIIDLNKDVLNTRLIRITVEPESPDQFSSQNTSNILIFKSSANLNLEYSL